MGEKYPITVTYEDDGVETYTVKQVHKLIINVDGGGAASGSDGGGRATRSTPAAKRGGGARRLEEGAKAEDLRVGRCRSTPGCPQVDPRLTPG